jgi:hypothetical protein
MLHDVLAFFLPSPHYLITILTVLTGHILTIYLICYYYILTIFNLFGMGNIISTIYYLFLTSWDVF